MVGTGKGVHKVGQRTGEHLEERIADGILLAPAKRRVLEDMGHACRIGRIGLEADAKDIIAVITCNMQVVRIGFVVNEMDSRKMQLRDVLLVLDGEAKELFSDFRICSNICHRRGRTASYSRRECRRVARK